MAQIKQGVVTSNKMANTVVVTVISKVKHPFYKKLVKRTKKFKAHDEIGVVVGQKVKIVETKPISKTVHFKVLEAVK